MTFATSYDGYGLALIGVPVAIIAAMVLFVLLIKSSIKMLTATTNRDLKVSIAILFVLYLILCPGLSGGAWFNLSSSNTSTAEYSWLLMICFIACCFVVAAIAGLRLLKNRKNSSSNINESSVKQVATAEATSSSQLHSGARQ